MATRSIAEDDSAIDALLAQWLATPAPRLEHLPPSDAIVARIRHHGIAGLLFERLAKYPDLPEDLAQFLRGQAIGLSFWEDAHAKVMEEAVDAMTAAGAQPLLFKGTALAYGHYDAPFARARGDSDVIVAPEHFTAASAALEAAGFETPLPERGNLVAATRIFATRDAIGNTHEIDLHCRINNSATLGGLFTFAELFDRSQPLPRLADEALALGPADAMMVACFHRQVHAESPYFVNGVAQRFAEDRLIWLADIDLIARSMNPDEWHQLTSLCAAKGFGRVVAGGLRAAEYALQTPLPLEAITALEAQPADTPAARYLAAPAGERTWRDWQATRGLKGRVQFFVQLLFPPAAYVRGVVPVGTVEWLPWLYTRYIAGRGISRIASLVRQG
jgi:hypothetical protein